MTDFYAEARQIVDPLSTGGLQWKLRQPFSEENSQATFDEVDSLINQLQQAKQVIPFTVHQTIESYTDQVMSLLPDVSRSKARGVVNYLLQQNFSIDLEQATTALNAIG